MSIGHRHRDLSGKLTQIIELPAIQTELPLCVGRNSNRRISKGICDIDKIRHLRDLRVLLRDYRDLPSLAVKNAVELLVCQPALVRATFGIFLDGQECIQCGVESAISWGFVISSLIRIPRGLICRCNKLWAEPSLSILIGGIEEDAVVGVSAFDRVP